MSVYDLDFERLVNPIEVPTFFNEYWEKRPLVIPRSELDYYGDLLSMKDIDSIIWFTRCKLLGVELAKDEYRVPPGSPGIGKYISRDGVPDLNQLYSSYSQGYSFTINDLHDRWQPVSIFRRNLEVFFNYPVTVNMFMTPPNTQGFAPHFDTHEVFILQVEGSKLWNIYNSPIDLPLVSNQKDLPKSREGLGEPLQICLNAGDLLYMPRGYIHEARTSDTFSLHLTVGVHVFRWSDLMLSAVKLLTQRDVRFRQSLPVGFLQQGEVHESLQDQYQELLQLLADKSQVEDAVEEIAERFLLESPPLADEHFYQLENINNLNLDTIVKKRAGICRVVKKQGRVVLQFTGNSVTGPESTERAFRFIVDTQEFPIKALPGLTDNSKLTLVRRLIREGLLTTVE
ncbi:cupin domain-containing protein [Nostoc sp.]|uniref:cupin domain-containing protein n=1 Tax=Nostoc sp. TaxID=1180 RepID=UPI002FF72AD0